MARKFGLTWGDIQTMPFAELDAYIQDLEAEIEARKQQEKQNKRKR